MFRYVICVTCDHLLLSRALEKQKNWTHRQAKECVVPCPRLVHCMRFAEPWAGKGEEIQNELKHNWRNHSTVLFNLWMVHCFMSHSYELWQSGQCAHDIVSLSDRSKGRIKAWRHRRKQDLTWCIFSFVVAFAGVQNSCKTCIQTRVSWSGFPTLSWVIWKQIIVELKHGRSSTIPDVFLTPPHGGHLLPSHVTWPHVAK